MSGDAAEVTPEPVKPPKPVAVIDIGTTSIRMAIAEIDSANGVRILETLSQAANLGKDTFTRGSLSKATIEQCVRVLKSYSQKLRQYQISEPSQLRVVATSAVREAVNRLAFLDRIYIATGIEVEPIDEVEVNRVTYLSILPLLQAEPTLANARSIIVEVGGGSTDLLLVNDGNVMYAHTYRLGSLRLHETLEAHQAPSVKMRQIMEGQIQHTIHQIEEHVPSEGSVEMIALGGDVRFAADQLLPDWNQNVLARIPVDLLEQFTGELLCQTEDEIVRHYHLSYQEAETVGPALLVYVQLAKALKLVNVIVSNTNLRDGLLKEMAVSQVWTSEYRNQIIRSALDLGRKFQFDEAHAQHVAKLCDILFEQLQDEHQLDSRYQLILHLAALLHELGMYVNTQSHHKHSMYLIQNSELFGLRRRDLRLVALTARYYRRATPKPTHEGYGELTRDERIAVSKMAALLRIGVALDDSRSQRIHEFHCERENDRLVISFPNIEDLSLEQLAVRQNCSIFEEIFGLQVQLRTVHS